MPQPFPYAVEVRLELRRRCIGRHFKRNALRPQDTLHIVGIILLVLEGFLPIRHGRRMFRHREVPRDLPLLARQILSVLLQAICRQRILGSLFQGSVRQQVFRRLR